MLSKANPCESLNRRASQIPAQQFRELGLQEGETLVVSPRKARVFLHPEKA